MVTVANPYRDQRTQYDPGMGMDELCDALNLGLYIGVNAGSGAAPTISSAIVSFLQSGSGAIARTMQGKARESVSVKDFGAVGDGTADDTAAIQACFDACSSGTSGTGLDGSAFPPTVLIPSGDYKIASTITVPNAIRVVGDGRWNSRLTAASGFAGVMMQDKGNAAKVQLENFQLNANDEAGVTNILDLGNGATSVWGTGGYAKGLLLRGGTTSVNTGTVGLYHQSNVISILDVHTMYCDTGIEEVAGSNVCYYDDISVLGSATYGLKTVGESAIGRIEIEAPTAACVGLYVNRQVSVGHMTYSQATGVTNPFAIEIVSGAVSFEMGQFVHAVKSGAVLTNVISDARSGYPANWGARSGSPKITTGIMDELHIGGTNAFRIAGMQFTNVQLQLTNTAGTLQHRIGSVGDPTVAGPFAASINGAVATLTNTPTGADGSTAFAAGGKVLSVATNVFALDTLDHATQQNVPILGCWVGRSTTGDSIQIYPRVISRDVNGVTRERLELALYDAATGNALAINTTTIGASESIFIFVSCFLLVTSG